LVVTVTRASVPAAPQTLIGVMVKSAAVMPISAAYAST
jgi:hypothetical protein